MGGPRRADEPEGTDTDSGWHAHTAPGCWRGGRTQVKVTAATEDDLPAIVGILNYSAANSIAHFDTRPVSVASRRGWFGQFSATGPYRLLVARRGDEVLGYACSQRYRDHEAFRETVEVSIALDVRSRGQAMGTALYRALFDSLALEPSVHVALAGIALPNDASVALHRKFGFTDVGTFREYAIKNGQYISSVWMQRLCHPAPPPRQ
ncbi:MAG TPA: GNAT family N-acetyltransferase [Streptosporangiaceae bacterium]